jgi:hypothetical protein
VGVLFKLVNGNAFNGSEPKHDFFKSQRVFLLRSAGSYSFPGTTEPSFKYDEIAKQWYLHFRTNIKNYDNEIEKFLDWIKPYIKQGSGAANFYAIVTYEEDVIPTIYYLDKLTD